MSAERPPQWTPNVARLHPLFGAVPFSPPIFIPGQGSLNVVTTFEQRRKTRFIAALVIHVWWLPKHGINGWTGEPKEKYYDLIGHKNKGL